MKTHTLTRLVQWLGALLQPQTIAINTGSVCPQPAQANPSYTAVSKVHKKPVHTLPVRVIRVSEVGIPRHSAGRMVISGRFADVCAELDRLAA